MATISFKVDDETIREFQEGDDRLERHEYEGVVAKSGLASNRLWAACAVAALDFPLPPKVEVGDTVWWGPEAAGETRARFRIAYVERGHVLALHDLVARDERPVAVLLDLSSLPEGFEVLEKTQ